MSQFTHFDDQGNARMVSVSDKDETKRLAIAKGSVIMRPETLALIMEGSVKKGDVLGVSQLAGIMGAKRAPDLIPLCHPLSLTSVKLELTCDQSRNAVDIAAACEVTGKTGVEMEALLAVSIAALTVYDMCKAVDRSMRIENIRLVHKSGGASGIFNAD